MKTIRGIILFACSMIILSDVATADTADYTRTANLKPSAPTDEWSNLKLDPMEMAIYNVNIDMNGEANGINYELRQPVPPPSMQPGYSVFTLWAWRQTSSTANSFVFNVVNTIWEEKTATVNVSCTWDPVAGDDNGNGEGEGPDSIPGWAKGIAEHQKGIFNITDLAILDPPDYLCINETLELSAWVMRPEDFPWDFLDSVEAEWEVTPTENGTIDPSVGHSVIFEPLETGDVTITAAAPDTDGPITDSITITVIKVEIESDPEPVNLICADGTKEYTAAITPATAAEAGTFTWSVSNEDKLGFVNNENIGQTVTVTGKQYSAFMSEELTVEFSVNGELICEPSTNLTVVKIEIEADSEPGDLICVGGTKTYTAEALPPEVGNVGEFTWRVNNENKLGFVNNENTGQNVTVTGKQYSASMNAEELTVEFRVNDDLICEPNTNLTIIRVDIKRDDQVITDTTTDVMVGQKIGLTGEVSPAGFVFDSQAWTIPDTTVKTYSQTVDKATKSDLTQTDLEQEDVSYYWIDGDAAREVKYTVVASGTTCEGKSIFNVKRPTATLISQTTTEQPPVGLRDLGKGLELVFGSFDSPGIAWIAEVNTPSNGAGKIAFVQLINFDGHMTLEDNRKAKGISDGYALDPSPGDGGVHYGGSIDIGSSDSQTLDDSVYYSDTPGSVLDSIDDQAQQAWDSGLKAHTRNDQFNLYLMYKSDSANSIWVTLRMLQWHWSGGATKDVQTGAWSLDAGATSSQNPGSDDSATLPEWSAKTPIGWVLDD